MKILIASTPATGHLNPLLAIGRILIAEGHEVVGLSGNALRERIEGVGAKDDSNIFCQQVVSTTGP
jgi:UDP:flavonoid glycosyltransferase YjiC (YdhE family)